MFNLRLLQRQIDLVTLIKLYCDVLEQLMTTEHFRQTGDSFDISSDDVDANDLTIDVNALESTVDNVCVFLTDNTSASYICEAIEETSLMDVLISIAKKIKDWSLNYGQLMIKVINSLAAITRNSIRITDHLRYHDKIGKLFDGLMDLGLPSTALLEACINLAYNEEMGLIIVPEVLNRLIDWLPNIDTREQTYLSEKVYKSCVNNYGTYVCLELILIKNQINFSSF